MWQASKLLTSIPHTCGGDSGLFEAMSKAASAPIEAVRNGYLEKLNVSQVKDLTHDGANQLISLVTAQLKKQSEKGNSND